MQQILLLNIEVLSLILPSRQKRLPNNQHALLLLVPYAAVGSLAGIETSSTSEPPFIYFHQLNMFNCSQLIG